MRVDPDERLLGQIVSIFAIAQQPVDVAVDGVAVLDVDGGEGGVVACLDIHGGVEGAVVLASAHSRAPHCE